MREYWKTSLFLYEIEEGDAPTPVVVFWRATVYTFHAGVDYRVLRRALNEFTEGDLIEPKDKVVAKEKRQVSASDSKGLGFGWIEFSRGEKHGLRVQPERRVAVWNLYAFQKVDARLGYASFLGKAREFSRIKRARKPLGGFVESFWRWLTR